MGCPARLVDKPVRPMVRITIRHCSEYQVLQYGTIRSGHVTWPNTKRQASLAHIKCRSGHVAHLGASMWRCPQLGSRKVFNSCQYRRKGPTRCGHVASCAAGSKTDPMYRWFWDPSQFSGSTNMIRASHLV